MPKSGKKGQKKSAYISLADIKLSDYANNPHAGSIRKKAYASTTTNNIYAIEKAWLKQEAESFVTDGNDDEEGSDHQIKKKSPRSKRIRRKEDDESGGVTYPLDVWYILGQYIMPEDVKVFALICKNAYTVSRMYSFWMGLYKKHYQEVKPLPLRLQPYCIERPLCLKACVVRALYHFYPKFVSRSLTHGDVHKLEKSPCVAMWYEKSSDNEWMFYFKFQSHLSDLHSEAVLSVKDPPSHWMELEQEHEKDPESLLEEVNCNPEDGYKVLQVKSPNFVAPPPVKGSCLVNAKIGLARDMTKRKLQLTFCFSSYIKTYKVLSSLASRECGGNAEIVEFDPVGSVVVLDWWNPRYPLVDKFY